MNSSLLFFYKHKWFSLIAGTLYFAATVVFHRPVAQLSLRIERQVTYLSYNGGWGLFAVVGLSLILLAVFIRIVKGKDRGFNLLFLVLTFGLIGVSHWVVLAVNLEYIHVIQFSLLVLPVFALTLRFGETVFWIGILGTIDELYQYYVVWWPHQSYFDFNDIALDIMGGAFMVFLLYIWIDRGILRKEGRIESIRWLRSPSLSVVAIILILAVLANITGLLRFYPESEENMGTAIILLSKDLPAPKFWSVFEKGKSYHIVGASEWLALLLFFTCLYSLLDWRNRTAEPSLPKDRGN